MRYFKWSGIGLSGDMVYGYNYARSEKALDAVLFKNEIALLRFKEVSLYWRKRFTYVQLALFFQQLAALLSSGIRLYDALMMAYLVIPDKQLRFFVQDCALQVESGVPFSSALQEYRIFLSDFVIQTVIVGEESGKLGMALEKLAQTLHEYKKFNKQLKTALIMPVLTISFFILLFSAIFFVVIPRFKYMLQGQQQVMPFITRCIFWVSDVLRSSYVTMVIAVFCSSIFIGWVIISCVGRFKWLKARIILSIPGLHYMVCAYSRIQFLQSLGFLLDNGVPLVKSLTMSSAMVSHSLVKQEYAKLAVAVNKGTSFAHALSMQPFIYTPELEAFIKAGLASGSLALMVMEAAHFYKERLYQKVSFCITLVQPVMLIVMGLLIAVLIIALYMPLFTFSSMG